MAIDKLTSQGLAPGAVTVNSINDNEITAAKLHTTAVQDKLGYTPVSPTELSEGLSTAVQAVIPTGTKMMFVQTTAPIGWTKDTTHDNKALRVVSGTAGSGGSVAFTTAFASQGVSGTIADTTAGGSVSVSGSVGTSTLSVGQLAAHSHSTFFFVDGDDGGGGRIGLVDFNLDGYSTTTTSANTGNNESHGHSFSGSGSFSGTAHNHSFTGTAINLAVQYVDVIIATKD